MNGKKAGMLQNFSRDTVVGYDLQKTDVQNGLNKTRNILSLKKHDTQTSF